jgi:septum formation topological specificity factor MinE
MATITMHYPYYHFLPCASEKNAINLDQSRKMRILIIEMRRALIKSIIHYHKIDNNEIELHSRNKNTITTDLILTDMKNLIYLIFSILWVAWASDIDDFEEEYHRSLRFRTNVKVCPDNTRCIDNNDCDGK